MRFWAFLLTLFDCPPPSPLALHELPTCSAQKGKKKRERGKIFLKRYCTTGRLSRLSRWVCVSPATYLSLALLLAKCWKMLFLFPASPVVVVVVVAAVTHSKTKCSWKMHLQSRMPNAIFGQFENQFLSHLPPWSIFFSVFCQLTRYKTDLR